MPQRKKPARLYLRRARPRHPALWVIRDGKKEVSTGAGEHEIGRAQKAYADYCADRHQPPSGGNQPSQLLVSEVMSAYLAEHVPTRPSKDWIGDMAADVLEWWGDKALSEINGRNCRAYVTWRTAQKIKKFTKNPGRKVSDQTARHELKTLRAAVNYYHKEHGPLLSLPVVTMPAKAPPKEDYFWSGKEAAQRLKAAWRRPDTRHLARVIMIGLYSGTRIDAMLRLRWLPSPEGGWVDVDNGIIHRRPYGAQRTTKRQPPARIHERLLPHLRKWREQDLAKSIPSVIHYEGQPIKRVKRSWRTIR